MGQIRHKCAKATQAYTSSLNEDLWGPHFIAFLWCFTKSLWKNYQSDIAPQESLLSGPPKHILLSNTRRIHILPSSGARLIV